MSEKHIKVSKALNYFEHIFIFIFALSGFVSISVFPSLIGIPVGITSSALELKTCAIIVGVKKYTSNIKKNRKN